jgi:hypothetical protein
MAIAVTSPAVGRLAAALGLERCRSATISLGVDEVVMIRAQQYAEVNQLTRMAAELETNEYVVITRHEYDKLKAEARPFADAAERSSTVSKTGEGQSGMRTERVTLEVTHDLDARLADWIVEVVDESLGLMESVRVVHEPKLASHANADGEANHAAQAASGGGEHKVTEGDCLSTVRDAGGRPMPKGPAPGLVAKQAASGGNPPETPEGSTPAAKPELPTD